MHCQSILNIVQALYWLFNVQSRVVSEFFKGITQQIVEVWCTEEKKWIGEGKRLVLIFLGKCKYCRVWRERERFFFLFFHSFPLSEKVVEGIYLQLRREEWNTCQRNELRALINVKFWTFSQFYKCDLNRCYRFKVLTYLVDHRKF